MTLPQNLQRDTTRAQPVRIGMTTSAAFVIVAAGALASTSTNAIAAEQFRSSSMTWPHALRMRSNPVVGDGDDTAIEETQSTQITELRRRSGLTWDKLGELFGVDRRSVHFWASGRPMNATNREKLGRILALIRRLPTNSLEVRAWLLSPNDGSNVLPFDQLRQGQYEEVKIPESPSGVAFVRPKVARQVSRERAPRPPEELVGALQDSVHRETSKLRAAIPLKKRT